MSSKLAKAKTVVNFLKSSSEAEVIFRSGRGDRKAVIYENGRMQDSISLENKISTILDRLEPYKTNKLS